MIDKRNESLQAGRRDFIFSIIIICLNLIFPFGLLFKVFKNKYTIDKQVFVERYNVFDLCKKFNVFYTIMTIILILSILATIAFTILILIKKKYYSIYLRISSGIEAIALISFMYFYSIYLIIFIFIFVCINMFSIAFDVKLNRRKKGNMISFILIYFFFVLFMVLSYGFIPTY